MKSFQKFLLILCCMCIFIANSCKTKKVVQEIKLNPIPQKQEVKAKNYETEIKQINANANQTNWYCAKAAVKYDDGKQAIGLDLEIQIEKNKETWVNVKTMGFINVARIVFQTDSVRILDYINRTYTSASYKYLDHFTSLPLGYSQIENLLLGNVLYPLDIHSTIVQKSNNTISTFNQFFGFKQRVNLNNLFKVIQTNIQDSAQKQSLQISYSQFIAENKNQFPEKIAILLKSDKQLSIDMLMNNLSFNKKRDWQLSVPKNYKVNVF
jgi:hypothetical protein